MTGLVSKRTADTHNRVRINRVDNTGLVALRHNGKLLHISVGRPHAGTRVLMLIQDLKVHVINAATGELIYELVLGLRLARENTVTLTRVRGVLRHHAGAGNGESNSHDQHGRFGQRTWHGG